MDSDDRTLEGRFHVIGRVRTGMDVVDTIAEVETDTAGRRGLRAGAADRERGDVVMEWCGGVVVRRCGGVVGVGMARAEVVGPHAKSGPKPESVPSRVSTKDGVAATDG